MFYFEKEISYEEAVTELEKINRLLDTDPWNKKLCFQKIKYYYYTYVLSPTRLIDGGNMDDLYKRMSQLFFTVLPFEPFDLEVFHSFILILYQRRKYQSVIDEMIRIDPDYFVHSFKSQTEHNMCCDIFYMYIMSHSRLGNVEQINQLLPLCRTIGLNFGDESIFFLQLDPAVIRDNFIVNGVINHSLLKDFLLNLPNKYNLESQLRKEFIILNIKLEHLLFLGLIEELTVCLNRHEALHGKNIVTEIYRLWLDSGAQYTYWDSDVILEESIVLDVIKQIPDSQFHSFIEQFCNSEEYEQVKERLISELADIITHLEQKVEPCAMEITWESVSNNSLPEQHVEYYIFLRFLRFMFTYYHHEGHGTLALVSSLLGTMYRPLPETELPEILYKLACGYAYDANLPSLLKVLYFRRYAHLLKDRRKYSQALRCLSFAEKWINDISDETLLVSFYETKSDCYLGLTEYKAAAFCYEQLSLHPSITEASKDSAQKSKKTIEHVWLSSGINTFHAKQHTSAPQKILKINQTPGVPELYMQYSGAHDLYDSLLNRWDSYLRDIERIDSRTTGRTFLQNASYIHEVLVATSMDIGSSSLAIQHIEDFKNVDLTRRIQFLRKCGNLKSNADIAYIDQLDRAYKKLLAPDAYHNIDNIFFNIDDIGESVDYMAEKEIRRHPNFSLKKEQEERIILLEFYYCDYFGYCYVSDESNACIIDVIRLDKINETVIYSMLKELHDGKLYKCIESGFYEIEINELKLEKFQELSALMDKLIYEPIAHIFDKEHIDTLVIIPYRGMHGLPLNLLGYSKGASHCLALRFPILFCPSLIVFRNLYSTEKQHDISKVLIIGNSIDGDSDKPGPLSLRGAEAECISINTQLSAHNIRTLCLIRKAAGYNEVVEDMTVADMIHIGCHGIFDRECTTRSGILLHLDEDSKSRVYLSADGKIQFHPKNSIGSLLTIDDLWEKVDVRDCQFVNLSSCYSGSVEYTGLDNRTDDFVGLINGFLFAGVKSILSNISVANDAVAFVFNTLFYQLLVKLDFNYAKALQQSLNQLVNLSYAQVMEIIRNIHDEERKQSMGTLIETVLSVSTDGKPCSNPIFWSGLRLFGKEKN